MTTLTTNRDLYLAVTNLAKIHAECQPSLESYLIGLRELGLRHRTEDSIGLDDFFSILRDAFSVPLPEFDANWVSQYTAYAQEDGFNGWFTTITRQIVDLHEMAESGELQRELRYFGMQSRRGSYWYNFDPCTYLECAMAGSIGGWEPEDTSGRTLVSGPVAVLDNDGKVVTMNPEEIPRPVYPLLTISWELFRDILRAGQEYE